MSRLAILIALSLILAGCGWIDPKKPAGTQPPAAGASLQSSTGTKIALVIGNADYNGDGHGDTREAISEAAGFPSDLKTMNDASDVRDALDRLGFDVVFVPDGTRQKIFTALDEWGRKIAAAGPTAVVVFYYAGHSMQVNGVSLLIPTQQQLPRGYDFKGMSDKAIYDTLGSSVVALPLILEKLEVPEGDGANVVILDSCRNNFWDASITGRRRSAGGPARGRGLAEQTTDLGATLIAYSTQPGNVASDGELSDRNSPYTSVLKRYLERPGLPVLNLFNAVSRDVERNTKSWDVPQRPWNNAASLPDICLAGCAAGGTPTVAAADNGGATGARALNSVEGRWIADGAPASGACDRASAMALSIAGETLVVTVGASPYAETITGRAGDGSVTTGSGTYRRDGADLVLQTANGASMRFVRCNG